MHVGPIFKFHNTGEGALLPPQTPPHHFSKLNFISKMLDFTKQINAYQERTQINTEVNERPLKNIGMRWNTRHRSFQRIPISFSLAKAVNVTLPAFAAERRCLQHGARSTPAVITRSLLPAAKGLAGNEPASGRCFCRSMGQTDGRPTVIEPAAHTMRATSAPLKLRPYGAIYKSVCYY